MSEELQNDSVDQVIVQPIEDQNIGAELATASEPGHEEKPNVEETAEDKAKAAQVLATEAINKQHKKFRDQERVSIDLQQQLDTAKAKEQERLAESFKNAPVTPEMPTYPTSDPFDESHESDVRKYHEGVAQYNANMPIYHQQIQNKAIFDAQQQNLLQQQQFQQQQTAQATQDARVKLGNDFFSTAISAGVSNNDVNLVVNTLNNMGVSSDLGDAIMADSDGYFVAKYLAGNPMEMHELNTMNPILAGTKLSEIKQKASALKPKKTGTPTPVDQLTGAGVQPDLNKYPNSAGATFT